MNDWHSAERHAEKAHQFYEAGQWAKALAELKRALAVNPEQSDWHFGMGLTLEAMQRYDEAAESFRQVLRLRGDDTEAMLHLAVALIRSNRHHQAIHTLEQIARLEPGNEAAYCYRTAAYTQLGDHDQAEQMFYLAQQINPDCPQCFDHIAMSLALRGDLDRAIWCWKKVLKLDPHYPDAYANLARAHWQRGQTERAHQMYILQLREDPGDIDALLQWGSLLVEMGHHSQAREKFTRVLELDPTVTEAYLRLGELSLLKGRLDTAAAELEMANRLDPDRPGIQLYLAKVAQHRSHPAAIRAHLLAELDRPGRNVPQSLQLAHMLIEHKLPQQAEEAIAPLIDRTADAPTLDDDQLACALFYRGVAWVMDSKIQAGVMQLRRALRLTPQNAAIMQQLVLANLQLHRLKRAAYWLSRIKQLKVDNRLLRRFRYRLFWAFCTAPFAGGCPNTNTNTKNNTRLFATPGPIGLIDP